MGATLLQTRKISGKGVLKIAPEETGKRYYLVRVDLLRDTITPYRNFNWNPPRGKYAYMTFLRNSRVIDSRALEFPNTEIQLIPDICGQALIALKCHFDGVNQSFINLGTALGAIYISQANPIKDYLNLDLGWDEIRFCCYADIAIQVSLYASDYDTCNPEYALADRGGEPPEIPDVLPPNSPVDDISAPYDLSTSDDGNTAPNDLDSTPPLNYRIRVIGSSYGGGCYVYPEDDVYVSLTDIGSGNYAIVNTGAGSPCGGFNFQVIDADDNRVIYTSTSAAINIHLEVTLM